LPEDWFTVNTFHSLQKPDPVLHLSDNDSSISFQFKTPPIAGPYRLFVKVKDRQGHFASANFPFYTVAQTK